MRDGVQHVGYVGDVLRILTMCEILHVGSNRQGVLSYKIGNRLVVLKEVDLVD